MAAKTTASSVQLKMLAVLQKQFGDEGVMRLGGGESRCEVRSAIPTGIDVVDHHVLGIGGFPCGRITELFGGEGGGKTSLGLAAVAGAQRMGGVAHIIETEHALDTSRATTLGCAVDDVFLHQPDTLEQVFEHIEGIVAATPDELPTLILWDSVAATPTQAELAAGAVPEKEGMAEFARVMSRGFRTLGGLLATKRVALVCINQIRMKVGVVFGNPETTPGGAALKFYATVRLQVGAGTQVKGKGDTGPQVGRDALVKCIKHKLIPPFREARARLLYASGWDNTWSTINFAKDVEAIDAGARITDATYRESLLHLSRPPHGWKVDPARFAAPAPVAKEPAK